MRARVRSMYGGGVVVVVRKSSKGKGGRHVRMCAWGANDTLAPPVLRTLEPQPYEGAERASEVTCRPTAAFILYSPGPGSNAAPLFADEPQEPAAGPVPNENFGPRPTPLASGMYIGPGDRRHGRPLSEPGPPYIMSCTAR